MPSSFAELQADMAANVTDEFGEPTQITFSDQPGNPYLVPGDDGTFDATGVVSTEDVTFDRTGRQDMGAMIKGASAEVRYPFASLATAQRKPKSGDKIRLTTREGLPLFRVSNGCDNGRGRWVCTLEPIKIG